MKQSNNDKSIQATSLPATSLKTYKAPRLTSYGDVSVLTKGSNATGSILDSKFHQLSNIPNPKS